MTAWSERDAEEHLLGLELFGMRFGLDRMHRLTTALGMPQRRFAQVHVVGSNGKSSTVRFVAALLERHGLRTGSYTSPHLRRFRERIEVGERPIAPDRFAAAVQRVAEAAALVERAAPEGDDRVTQFEALTAAAFHELALGKVDVAAIEAGLGGRYDATNVIPSKVQVLTGVGLEHTRWLGPTIADIAAEKLAVVRDHATLVVPEDLHPDARAVAERVAGERHARLVVAPGGVAVRGGSGDVPSRSGTAARDIPRTTADSAAAPTRLGRGAGAAPRPAADSAAASIRLGRGAGDSARAVDSAAGFFDMAARGAFQRRNFALACAAAEAFLERPLDPGAVEAAAAETRVPGRLEIVAERPLTIHDGAHNPAGAAALAAALPEVVGDRRPLVLVVSVLDDKAAADMLRPLLPLADHLVFTRCSNPRALPPATLESLSDQLDGTDSEIVPDPRTAMQRARSLATPAGAVLATGSIYLVADLVRDRDDRPSTL